LLTEGPVIVQAIRRQGRRQNLAPAAGSPERYRLQEWPDFITPNCTRISAAIPPVIPMT